MKGFYVEPLQKIKFVCKKYLEKKTARVETFRIKLSADGTSITKSRVNVLVFTFTLLNDVKNAQSVFGQMILGKYFFIMVERQL